jgi:hypothetical protein
MGEVVVYIWPYKSLAHFGHAAIRLKDAPGTTGPDTKVYMSWWPGADKISVTRFERTVDVVEPLLDRFDVPAPYSATAKRNRTPFDDRYAEMSTDTRKKLADGTYKAATLQVQKIVGVLEGVTVPGTKVYPTLSLTDIQNLINKGRHPIFDKGVIRVWVQNPEKVRIPMQGSPGAPWGLDGARMFRWWEAFSHSPKQRYRLLSTTQNCAGVIARALQAGGAELFAPIPKPTGYMHPNHVHEWAKRVNGVIDKYNKMSAIGYKADCKRPVLSAAVNRNTGTFSAAEWKKQTRQGFGHTRSQYLQRIDQLLQKYETFGWRWTAADYDQRIAVLGQIMDQINKHLIHNPHSSRTDPVLKLGEQILDTVRRHATFMKQLPPLWA